MSRRASSLKNLTRRDFLTYLPKKGELRFEPIASVSKDYSTPIPRFFLEIKGAFAAQVSSAPESMG
jgi:hypothetical protein